jgi:hypothetical protein
MSPTLSAKISAVSAERAKQIVEKAAQEANDVLQAAQSDPMKKPKQMKTAVKEEVAKIVESGDPSKVVQYIKGNKKDFISGVYMSWFMKEIRSQLEGGLAPASSAAGAAAPKEEKKAAPSQVPEASAKVLSKDAAKTGTKKAAASAKVAEKNASAAAEALEAAQAESKIAGGPEKRKRQKQHASPSEAEDHESASEAEEERPAKKTSTTCTSGSHMDVGTLQSPFRGDEEKDEKDDDSKTAIHAEAQK